MSSAKNKNLALVSDMDKTTVLQGEKTLSQEIEKAKDQEACLIVIRGTRQGHRYFLSEKESILGRDPTCEVAIDDPSISRKHAKIVRKDEQVILVDLGSSNGSMINGNKVDPNIPIVLKKEDMIRLGSTILKFLPAGEFEILFFGQMDSAVHLDALTKIYNKGYLMEALDAEFKRTKALKGDFSVLFFDLDFFKKINDQFGHDAGDSVLREFSYYIQSHHVRDKDVFARYGGEEFVLLLVNTDLRTAKRIAENIRKDIEIHEFVYEGKRLPVTTSIGVASLNFEMQSAKDLLKIADQALYSAKNSGRNRVFVGS